MTMKGVPGLGIAAGGRALREGRFADAASRYLEVLQWAPGLAHLVGKNLENVRRRAATAAAACGAPMRVGVCSWDLGHNCAGRAYALALIYRHFASVEVIGSIFPRYGSSTPWSPLVQSHDSVPIRSFLVRRDRDFMNQALRFVAANPYEVVHLSKPRLPNLLMGALYKKLWRATVLCDFDDEELAFFPGDFEVNRRINKGFVLEECIDRLDGLDATKLAMSLCNSLDGLTTASEPLRSRYGGVLIPHVRATPTHSLDLLRQSGRSRLGLSEEQFAIVFTGTPRAHKGLLETASAIASLRCSEMIYIVIGGNERGVIEQRLKQISNLNLKILGPQPLSDAAMFAAAADLAVVIQDQRNEVAKMQMPAKITDYLAVGTPVLVSDGVVFDELIRCGAVREVSNDRLSEEIHLVSESPALRREMSDAGKTFFSRRLSDVANVAELRRTVENARVRSRSMTSELLEVLAYDALPPGIRSIFLEYDGSSPGDAGAISTPWSNS